MSRRLRSTESPVSLFTFLDVLMCTMGALILLLMALSLRMRPDENPTAEFVPPASVTPPEPLPATDEPTLAPPRYTAEDRERDLAERLERHEKRRAELSAATAAARNERDRQQQRLEKRQRMIATAEKKIRENRDRVERAASQSDAAQKARASALAAEKKLKGLEDQVVEQIEATRRNLDLENRKQAAAPNEYALIPYDGTSGTMRRPIYIECSRHGYRFIPENAFIGPEHLDGFSENYNPLLTGTQALLKYWNARRRESGGQDPEPYVLLIVRPSGSLAYYLARKLLAPVGANFGYELVEEDWKLAIPPPDPRASIALRDAIDVTVEARQSIRESLAARGDRKGPLSFNNNHRAISRGELPGGIESGGDGPAGGNGQGQIPQGFSAARPGSQPGGVAAGRSGPARPYGDGPGSGVAGGTERNPGQGNIHGTGPSPGGGTGKAAQSAASAGNSSLREGNAGAGPDGLTPFGDPGEGDLASGDASPSRGSGGARNGAKKGKPGGPRPATISGRAADAPMEGSTGEGDGNPSSRGPGSSGVARNGGELPPLAPLPGDVAPLRNRPSRIVATNGPHPPGRLKTLEPEGDDGESAGSEGVPGGSRTGTPGSPATRPGPASSGTGAPGGGAVGENGGVGLTLGAGGGGGGEPPPPGGKKRWGRSHGRAGIGLERSLEIHSKADRLLIGPDDATIPVVQGDKTNDILQRVMTGIEQAAYTWEAPPANFYWLPTIKFVVYPGGSGYYERLRGPLEKMGVNSTVQYAPAATTADRQGGAQQ
jgi:hypothetical protein